MSKKNNLKYKNKIKFLAKIRRKIHEMFEYRYEDVTVAKHEIDLDSYKFLYRHLVKINKALRGICFITLSKAKYNGTFGYTVVISLKVIR